jgi:hypothetical protein
MRTRCILLVLVFGALAGRPAASQGAHDGNRPLYVGLVATTVPAAGAAVLLAASNSSGPGLALASAAAIFGPSAGDWSGGLTGRGLMFAGLRTGTLAVGLLGVAASCWDDCSSSEQSTSRAIGIATGVALAGLMAWDLATVPGAVRRHEERRVSVMPGFDPVRRTAALAVTVRF